VTTRASQVGGRPLARAVAAALVGAALVLPSTAQTTVAIDLVNAVPMDCAILAPHDIAVLGADTIVVGQALDETDPVGDMLLCRVTPSGAAIWTRTLTDILRSEPVSVAIGSGGIYVSGTALEDPSQVTYGWVRRFALDGTPGQSTTIASGFDTRIGDIAVAPDGKVLVTGKTDGILGDDPPPPRIPTQADAFVRAFEPDLDVLWTDQFRGTVSTEYDSTPRDGFAWGTAIAADYTGVYVTGLVIGALPGGPAMRWQDDAFVRRYSSAGSVIWTRQFDATWPDAVDDFHSELQTHSRDIALSAQGVHVVGMSQWLGNRDPGTGYDAFQRVYDRNGNVVWTKEVGGWDDDVARRVMPDATGSVILGVAPQGLGDPGGSGTYFLARFGPTGQIESIMEFAPDGWVVQGSAAIGDGAAVRFASVVVDDPYSDPGSSDVIPPPGTNLVWFDAIPPTVAGPSIRPVVNSTLSWSSMPLDVSWSATDGASQVASSEVQVSRNGGPWQGVTVPAPDSRVARTSGLPGGTIRARVRVTDGAGNASSWVYGPTVALQVVQETSRSISETSSWRRLAQTSALGGFVDKTNVSGASARYRFTGRGIVWLTAVGPTRGRADIYIDGRFVTRIDTYAAAFAGRRVAFQRTWSGTGIHTLEIRNRATLNRPRIDLDAFIVLK
jgi:hypothetical protein